MPGARLTAGTGFGLTRIEKVERVAVAFTTTGEEPLAGVIVIEPVFDPRVRALVIAVTVKTEGIDEAVPLIGEI